VQAMKMTENSGRMDQKENGRMTRKLEEKQKKKNVITEAIDVCMAHFITPKSCNITKYFNPQQ
jgi:hypothetical protein